MSHYSYILCSLPHIYKHTGHNYNYVIMPAYCIQNNEDLKASYNNKWVFDASQHDLVSAQNHA